MEEISLDERETIQDWATFTSFKQDQVRGIWNKFAEKTDVVTIDGKEDAGVIAAGDETGLIKLFRFDCRKRGAHFKKYVGHSSSIGKTSQMNFSTISILFFSLRSIGKVSFLFDNSRLISIGTNDRTIIQWQFFSESDSIALIDAKVTSTGPLGYAAPSDETLAARVADATMEELDMIETAQQVGAHLDTDSGDSDSDLSGAEIDSDIEKEKQVSYDRTLYREDYQVKSNRSFV